MVNWLFNSLLELYFYPHYPRGYMKKKRECVSHRAEGYLANVRDAYERFQVEMSRPR